MVPNSEQTSEKIIPGSLAVIFPHAEEAAGLKRKLSQPVSTRCVALLEHCGSWKNVPVVIAEVGGGVRRAARGTRDLIIMRRPRWVIAAGFAVSLKSEIECGHILLPDVVSDQQGNSWPVACLADSEEVNSRPKFHAGKLVTLPALPQTEAERQAVIDTHQALACDTQTQAIAEVCQRENVRFLSVKIIDRDPVDGLVTDLEPIDRRPTRAGKLGAAARALFQRPGSIQDIWQRKKQAKELSDRLAQCLTGVIEQLQQRDKDEKRIAGS